MVIVVRFLSSPNLFITQEYKQIIDEESVLSQIAEEQLEQQAVLKKWRGR